MLVCPRCQFRISFQTLSLGLMRKGWDGIRSVHLEHRQLIGGFCVTHRARFFKDEGGRGSYVIPFQGE